MFTNIHTSFEKDTCPLKSCETDEKIREFAEWASKKLPEHTACFVLIIDKQGYVTNAIPNNGVIQ
jgi:hypothetical protein